MWLTPSTLLNKYSFVFHYGDKTFKVFTPAGMKSRVAEINGNDNALRSLFWNKHLIKVHQHPIGLFMKKGKPVSTYDMKEVDKFMETKLQIASNYPFQNVANAYNYKFLINLEKHGLKKGLISQIEEIMKHTMLPLTSSHGDLHAGNMIWLDNEIKIIDWSMFSETGSFITDYIHFYNYRSAVDEGISWTKSIFNEYPFLCNLSQNLNVNKNILRLAYSITRISGEVMQLKKLNLIPVKQINKYNFVLFNLINSNV